MGSVLVTLSIVGACAGSASADPIRWELVHVAFDDGGTASGFFTTDFSDWSLLDWSITVRGGDEGTFEHVTYTPASSDGVVGAFVIPGPGLLPLVRFTLPDDRRLLMSGEFGRPGLVLLGERGSESLATSTSRFVTSGSLVGVPEPGTAVLLGLGIGMMASRRHLGWH